MDRLVERGQQRADLDARGGAQHVELELRPGRRGQLEQVAGRGLQPREPPADDLAHALGRAQLARVGERAPELADEERVAAGQLADLAGDLRVGAHELGHLVARQPREPQAHDVLGAAQVGQRLAQRLRHVGVAEGGQHQQARAGAAARQVPQQAERRPVGPVRVLEHEQHRAVLADPRQQVGDRGVQAVADRVRVGVGRFAPELGQQARELAAGRPERGPQLLGVDDAYEVVERLHEGAVGRAHDRVAGAVEHQRAALGGLCRELAHEPALARAGLAADQHDPPAVVGAPRQQGAQRVQLVLAPDEGERGRQAQRSRKRHGSTIVRSDYRCRERAR